MRLVGGVKKYEVDVRCTRILRQRCISVSEKLRSEGDRLKFEVDISNSERVSFRWNRRKKVNRESHE